MKKSIKYIWMPIVVLAMIAIVAACEESAETYNEFTKDGETIYIGKPDTVLVAHGFKKLLFSVVINADPKISKGVLQTKDKSIVHEFDINRTAIGQDTIKFSLDLDQGEYNFDIFLKDNAGHQSIFREVPAVVFGENYANSLLARGISGIRAFSDNAIIDWGAARDGTIATTLVYEDAAGIMQTLDIPNEATETIIDSYKLDGTISVISSFKPTDTATEAFNSKEVMAVFPDKFILDHTLITALKLPFDASDGCYGSTYERLTNGATGEFWHSCEGETDTADQYPWIMSFDMGVTAKIRGFKLDERSGCCGDRSPAAYQIWGTNDLSGGDTADIDAGTIADWEADATTKGWVKLLDVTGNTQPTFTVDIPENASNFKYIRVVGIASIGGGATANFDEFTFMASVIE